jgi:hypothetical protein
MSDKNRGIHHIAFRVNDEPDLKEEREQLPGRGFLPAKVIDRYVYNSVYSQTPGGVFFEMVMDVNRWLNVKWRSVRHCFDHSGGGKTRYDCKTASADQSAGRTVFQ